MKVIRRKKPRYGVWIGILAAAALVLCGQSRSLLPATVEKRLKSAAYDLGNSTYYGAGFLNMKPFLKGRIGSAPVRCQRSVSMRRGTTVQWTVVSESRGELCS